MKPGRYDITLYQGAPWSRTVKYYNANRTAFDLTGYNARMKIKLTKDDTTTLLSLTSSPAAGIVITPATGTIAITITTAQTAALSFESGVYDLEVYTAADAAVLKLLEGTVLFKRETTK